MTQVIVLTVAGVFLSGVASGLALAVLIDHTFARR